MFFVCLSVFNRVRFLLLFFIRKNTSSQTKWVQPISHTLKPETKILPWCLLLSPISVPTIALPRWSHTSTPETRKVFTTSTLPSLGKSSWLPLESLLPLTTTKTFLSSQADNMPKEPSWSTRPTPVLTTSEESGLQVLWQIRTPRSSRSQDSSLSATQDVIIKP